MTAFDCRTVDACVECGDNRVVDMTADGFRAWECYWCSTDRTEDVGDDSAGLIQSSGAHVVMRPDSSKKIRTTSLRPPHLTRKTRQTAVRPDCATSQVEQSE